MRQTHCVASLTPSQLDRRIGRPTEDHRGPVRLRPSQTDQSMDGRPLSRNARPSLLAAVSLFWSSFAIWLYIAKSSNMMFDRNFT